MVHLQMGYTTRPQPVTHALSARSLSPLDCEALRMTALDNENPEPWKAMDKYDRYC